jgi:hypothetical protein
VKEKKTTGCDGKDCGPVTGIAAVMPAADGGESGIACCGPPSGPAAPSQERPGYRLLSFVKGFVSTPAGKVPLVHTRPTAVDRLGTAMVRSGFRRNRYSIAPGLYGTGSPDERSPVLISANYKLSFDHLRFSLGNLSAWIVVLDTRGINVWCAAGKGTFATGELVHRLRATRLEKVCPTAGWWSRNWGLPVFAVAR